MSGGSPDGKKTRVRFAPSPTGELHVGGARTALYNWLLARNMGGKYVLRIEDTDPERSTEDAAGNIMEDLKWLGLDWDEGPDIEGPFAPYRQSRRRSDHAEAVEELLKVGRAYRCFCDPGVKVEKGKPCPGGCFGLNVDTSEDRARSEEFAVRFRPPTGVTVVHDLIRGEVKFENESIEDFVVMRRDGSAPYNLAAAVDDWKMRIDLVLRGDDHLANTPKQIMLLTAMGAPLPRYAHLPMIIGEDGKPLSKREGSSSVEALRAEGFLPGAVINFLALLGWSLDESTTIMSLDDMVANFSLDRVSKSPATFDREKLEWINGNYIREMGDEELAESLIPFLASAGLIRAETEPVAREKLVAIASICKERLKRLDEIPEWTRFFFERVDIDQKLREKVMEKDYAGQVLERSLDSLRSLEEWDKDGVESALRDVCEEMDLKPRKGLQVIRVAVSGSKVSPPLFESLEILGRDESLKRLEAAAD